MKEFCTYIHVIDGKPLYVGEGSINRPHDFKERRSDYRRFLEESDVDVIIVGKHGDKVSCWLNEQGLISWIGLENLENKLPYYGRGYASYGFKGKKHSPEWIRKHKERMTGHAVSEETRQKLSEKRRGTTIPEERKRRISETKRSRRLICPHCGMVGGVSNMKRYHFENCKSKL
jgi:hypothetical protein